MSTLAAALVTTEAALAALWPDWEALWRRAPRRTPFQHPAWMRPWWRQFGTDAPRVAVLRDDDGRLLGLLPLYVLDEGAGPKLLPIGAGITDYQDALLAPEAPPGAAARLLDVALRDADAPCDLIDLPPGAALRDASPPAGWRPAWRDADPCPVLALPAAIPPALQRKLRMNRNRIARAGGFGIEIADGRGLAALLEAMMALHERRWGSGVLADPRVRAFHREAAPRLLAAGLLWLQAMHVGGRLAAAYYALRDGPRVLFYLSAYEPMLAALSPGSVLLAEMLAAAAREGCTEAHFLRGGESYKYAWGALDRVNAACRLQRI